MGNKIEKFKTAGVVNLKLKKGPRESDLELEEHWEFL